VSKETSHNHASQASKTSQVSNISKPTPTPTKLGGIGFSWSNLRGNGQAKSGKFNNISGGVLNPVKEVTDAVFSQEDLELQWMSMCNRMPQEYSGIATRMKNMNPVITDFPKVEVVVDNTLVQQEMENFKGRIVKTLVNSLHNSDISLDITVAEMTDRPKLLTRREQFELMSKENPAVEILRQEFDLQLA
jgi:DNA polymerase-3 subunit gamma/tau